MDESERHLVEDLVTKARAGDPEAFSCLVELYSPDLIRFVRLLVGNPHDSHEVLQDAWLAAWRCLHKLRNGAAFRPWLFGIAKNRVSRIRCSKSTETPLDEANELAAPGDLREEVQLIEGVERLRQCLDRLRSEERTVIELRIIDEMTYEEIVAVTRWNLGTVRSRLSRAKQKLRRWAGVIRKKQ